MGHSDVPATVEPDPGLDLTKYDASQYNILSPVLRMDTAAPFLRARAVEVRLDPDLEKGDCYASPGTRWEKIRETGELLPAMVSPSKPGLLKIAAAGGLVIDPRQTHRIRSATCEKCLDNAKVTGQALRCGDCPCKYDVAYQTVGAVRSDTGWRILKSTYEWELDAQTRKIRREGKKRAAKAQEKGQSFDIEGYVEDRLDQVIAERYGLAETKSLERLIRAIMATRQAYTRQEMANPFVVTRTELAPDFADPEVRRMLAERAVASGSEIFSGGGARALPAPTVRVLQEVAEEPNFEDPAHVETVTPEVEDEEPPAEEPGPQTNFDNGGADPASDGPGPTEAVCCDDCQGMVPDNVVAFCQSAHGRNLFGGAIYCFGCQKKHREAAAR